MIGNPNQNGIMIMLPKSISIPRGFFISHSAPKRGPCQYGYSFGSKWIGQPGPPFSL